MRWMYLSPHFDDVVLSCGGLIWQQVQAGQAVHIWTVCAGMPPEDEPISDFARQLHERWQTGPSAVLVRQREDQAAADVLGASLRFGIWPDCIYRRLPGGAFLVNGEDDLWQPLHPLEAQTAADLTAWLQEELQPGDQLVSPMTLGNHVDHHLVRAASEAVGRPIAYYADYPYAVRHPEALQALLQPTWRAVCTPISSQALVAWQMAVAQHASQISTFWQGLDEMRAALKLYWQAGGGSCLWLSEPSQE